MIKVYLSGPITGQEDTTEERFMHAEKEVKKVLQERDIQSYEVVNPTKVDHSNVDHQLPTHQMWQQYMRNDVKAMMDCQYVYFMNGWQKSKGCMVEMQLAHKLGMVIIFGKPL